ncbi:MAG: hypothetical protein WC323_02270 [Patescibacteria group bacterium]|jgi:rubrerythrin
MQEQDLQQIKKIIDDSLEEKLEGKLEDKVGKFKEEVRGIVKEEVNRRVEKSENLITAAIAQGFDDVQKQFDGVQKQFDGVQKQFDGVNEKLDKKANESTVLNWGDKQVIPLKTDVDKLKFLHKDEWKELPDSGTVSRILVEEKIKN